MAIVIAVKMRALLVKGNMSIEKNSIRTETRATFKSNEMDRDVYCAAAWGEGDLRRDDVDPADRRGSLGVEGRCIGCTGLGLNSLMMAGRNISSAQKISRYIHTWKNDCEEGSPYDTNYA